MKNKKKDEALIKLVNQVIENKAVIQGLIRQFVAHTHGQDGKASIPLLSMVEEKNDKPS